MVLPTETRGQTLLTALSQGVGLASLTHWRIPGPQLMVCGEGWGQIYRKSITLWAGASSSLTMTLN